jgi:imidazolonepropionase-like amidohydrolase
VTLLIQGGLIWDGWAPDPRPLDLSIDDYGKVVVMGPPGSVRAAGDDLALQLDGAYVLPGLIDMHVHLVWSGGADPVGQVEAEGEQLTTIRGLLNAQKQLAAGITTVRDLGSNADIAISVARAIDRGFCEGPTVIASGRSVIMTGGHDAFWGIPSDGRDAVTQAVRHQVSAGAQVIKTAATGGAYGRAEGEEIGQAELTYDELAAIAAEAHRFGLRASAHALGTTGIRNAVIAGIDTIEHGVFLTEEIVAEMLSRGTALCPTLATYRRLATEEGVPAYAANKARTVVQAHAESVRMAIDAGVTVVAGTDAGAPFLPHPASSTSCSSWLSAECPPSRLFAQQHRRRQVSSAAPPREPSVREKSPILSSWKATPSRTCGTSGRCGA